jgi:Zn-dependent M28 family amino/carboxypeptidase
MTVLTKTAIHRNYQHPEQLNEIADYLLKTFLQYADTAYFQTYTFNKREYKNVIACFGTQHKERIIVGAHYDVCGEQEGADDNASGTVGLLELARQLDSKTLNHRVDLVAYTLEEPPFFRTEYMGSYIHAQSLVHDSVDVKGMVCLEMIGYFADGKKTQNYPVGFLKLFYGSRGNYITLVNHIGPGAFAQRFTKLYKRKSTVEAKQFKGSKNTAGVDFSDHLNYWAAGISALMITDTAFYRNKSYHQPTDTMDRLDYDRMAKVIDGVLMTLNGF